MHFQPIVIATLASVALARPFLSDATRAENLETSVTSVLEPQATQDLNARGLTGLDVLTKTLPIRSGLGELGALSKITKVLPIRGELDELSNITKILPIRGELSEVSNLTRTLPTSNIGELTKILPVRNELSGVSNLTKIAPTGELGDLTKVLPVRNELTEIDDVTKKLPIRDEVSQIEDVTNLLPVRDTLSEVDDLVKDLPTRGLGGLTNLTNILPIRDGTSEVESLTKFLPVRDALNQNSTSGLLNSTAIDREDDNLLGKDAKATGLSALSKEVYKVVPVVRDELSALKNTTSADLNDPDKLNRLVDEASQLTQRDLNTRTVTDLLDEKVLPQRDMSNLSNVTSQVSKEALSAAKEEADTATLPGNLKVSDITKTANNVKSLTQSRDLLSDVDAVAPSAEGTLESPSLKERGSLPSLNGILPALPVKARDDGTPSGYTSGFEASADSL